MYANITATFVHICLSILLVQSWGMGILGVSIASSVQFMVRFLVTIGYIKFSGKFDDPSSQVGFFESDSMRHWKSQFFLSLQCMSLSVWSWWAMDIFTLIATYMPSKVMAGQHIMRNITLLTFMIPCGLMVSAGILTGNNIGANKIAVAKAYAFTCVKTSVVWALGTVLLLLTFQSSFLGIFTKDPEVRLVVETAFPVMLCYVFIDCVQCVGQGIIRGLGKQGVSSIGTLIGYWAIGIPVALFAVFKLDWGVAGLWMGPSLAIAFNFCFYYAIVVKTDWQKVADDSAKRRQKEKEDRENDKK